MPNSPGKQSLVSLAADLQAFARLEPVIHTKSRLAIMSFLAASDSLSFTDLRDGLRLTDGNLAAHLRALEQAGFLRQRKIGNPKKPVTMISLSAAGRDAFADYLKGLEHIVNRHR